MARATFLTDIKNLYGAIDSAKSGKANRRREVFRRHDYGPEKNLDEDGSQRHEAYIYHFHEGAWSEAATRNREMIKTAQRMAHDIERNPEERAEWEAKYAEYKANLQPGGKCYHFYNFIYVTIYRELRKAVEN